MAEHLTFAEDVLKRRVQLCENLQHQRIEMVGLGAAVSVEQNIASSLV